MFCLGKFEVQSGEIRVTDPCYTPDTWCAGKFPAKNGSWTALVEKTDEGSWGHRISKIKIVHNSIPISVQPNDRLDIDVGVDSGQAGFFDEALYNKHQGGEYGQPETFYGRCCEATLGDQQGAVVSVGCLPSFGCVSSSGFGDGGYKCYVLKNQEGLVVAAEVIFIGDEEEDYEDDYEDEEEVEEEEEEEA